MKEVKPKEEVKIEDMSLADKCCKTCEWAQKREGIKKTMLCRCPKRQTDFGKGMVVSSQVKPADCCELYKRNPWLEKEDI